MVRGLAAEQLKREISSFLRTNNGNEWERFAQTKEKDERNKV